MPYGEAGPWAPDIRDEFGVDIEVENHERMEKLVEFWHGLLKDREINLQVFRHQLNEYFLKALDHYNHSELNRAEKQKEISYITGFYQRLFEKMSVEQSNLTRSTFWDFPTFKAGFIAEYAAAEAFEHADCKAYYPTEKDDNYLKVDWWVKRKGTEDPEGNIWGVQSKLVSVKGGLDRGLEVVPISINEDCDRLGQFCFPDNQDRRSNLIRQAKHMLDKSKIFTNVEPVYLLVSDGSYDNTTGQPKQKMIDKLSEVVNERFE